MTSSTEVDLKDVKLQYLQNTGRDHHFYNLWEDRLRGLRRKPLARQAAQGIDPERGLIDTPQDDEAAMIQEANRAGLRNVQVSRNLPGANNAINVEYDHQLEEDRIMREMGYVI